LIAGFGACAVASTAIDSDTPAAGSLAESTPAEQPPMVVGDGQSGYEYVNQTPQPRDLTLANFWDAGWTDEWVKRERPTDTPDQALLRVGTNFMEREMRLNYYFQQNPTGSTTRGVTDFDGLIAWSFNRRLMVEITGLYQWNDPAAGVGTSGSAPGMVTRFQLIDTESSSYAVQLKWTAPNEGLASYETTFNYQIAGFEDLDYWFGLKRTAFYYSLAFDSYEGPGVAGAKRNDCVYDVTIAKTVTDKRTPLFGNLTFFVENYATTDMDGTHEGRTLVTITPGIRFNLGKVDRLNIGKDNCILFGTDIPVSGYQPWDALYRFTYIKNF
jgi:hypothetical protein